MNLQRVDGVLVMDLIHRSGFLIAMVMHVMQMNHLVSELNFGMKHFFMVFLLNNSENSILIV
jgi:hypothetical protein